MATKASFFAPPGSGTAYLSIESKDDEVACYKRKLEEIDLMIDDIAGRPDVHDVPDDERRRQLKKRNALYSQRKYYRKKIKTEELERARDSYIHKNSMKKEENEILEAMLTRAKEQVQTIEAIKKEISSNTTLLCRDSLHPSLLSHISLGDMI